MHPTPIPMAVCVDLPLTQDMQHGQSSEEGLWTVHGPCLLVNTQPRPLRYFTEMTTLTAHNETVSELNHRISWQVPLSDPYLSERAKALC